MWTSFKIAIYIAAVLASLINTPAEAIEPPANNNQVYHERLLNDQEVILVGRDSSGTSSNVPSKIGRQGQSPSNFPTPPASVYVPKYRPAPKVVPGPGLGAGGNPAGAGGAADDKCSAPNKEQSQQSKTYDYDYRSNDPKKKKQSAEQCELNDNLNNMPEFGPILEGSVVPVESLLGTSSGFKAQYKNLKKNSIAHKQATDSIERLAAGSLKIGDKNVRKIRGMKNIYEAKSKSARVYFQINGDTVQIILPALKTDQKQSIKLLKKYFK